MRFKPPIVWMLISLAAAQAARPVAHAQAVAGEPKEYARATLGIATMTLAQALAYSRVHQPSLRAAQARIAVAQRAASALRAEWLPQLGASAQLFYGTMNNSTAMFLGVRTVDLPRIGGSRSDGSWADTYPSSVVALGLRQNIYDFGYLAALSAAADAEAAAMTQRARQEALDVALHVESMFYAVLAAKAVERAAEDAHRRAVLRHDMVKASVDRGLRPSIDLSRAEADLTRSDVGRTRARAGIETAQALWAAAVGVPEPLLDALEEGEVSLTGDGTALAALPTLGGAFDQALAQDPGLRAALARLAAQQAATRATLRRWAPSLSLTAGVSGRAGGAPTSGGPSGQSGWLPTTPNWDIGLVLQAPIFDGVLLARQRQSQAQEDVLRAEVDAARRRLLVDVQRAYTAFRLAESALPALRAAALAAQKNDEHASARFRIGLSTSIELADAQALRTDAEIQLAVGRFELFRARAAFHRCLAQGL